MSTNDRLRPLFALGVAVAAATLFTACDTSSLQSGIEGTGITNTETIAAVSLGPIQSVDEAGVAVNGVTWSATGAETFIDGAASSPSSLKPGMMATVEGERAARNLGNARLIRTQIVVRGPILGIDAAKYRLNVLGQTIVVDRRTRFDTPTASLDVMSVGETVTVSGFVMATGEVRATLLSSLSSAATQEWVVNGAVTATDPSIRQLAINGLNVVYTAALLAQLPSGAIEIGQPITVSGTALTADGALIATRLVPYGLTVPATGAETVLSGMIARIEGDAISFWNQRIVLLPGAVITEPLAAGQYVRATGRMQGEILYASDVLVLGSGPVFVYLVGFIDAINVASRTLTMFGVDFNVSEKVHLDNFAIGQRVSVTAHQNRFISSVESARGWPYSTEGLVLIEGEFRELSPPSQFALHGVTDWVVQISPTTLLGYHWLGDLDECYAISVSAERFWELATQPKPPGVTTVWAWGRLEGGLLLATAAGICFPSPP